MSTINFTRSLYERKYYGLILIGLALYLIGCLYSFNPSDPSVFATHYPSLGLGNYGGKLGAEIAGILFFYFGSVAFCLPFPLLIFALIETLYQRQPYTQTLKSLFIVYFLLLFPVSFFYTYSVKHTKIQDILFLSTGSLGRFTFNYTLLYLGKLGAWILNLTFLTISLFYLLNIFSFLSLKARFFSFSPSLALAPLRKGKNHPINAKIKLVEVLHKTHQQNLIPIQKNTKNTTKTIAQLESDLLNILESQNVKGKLLESILGPSTQTFIFVPEKEEKIKKILSLSHEISLALRSDSVEINVIPNKGAIGIEIPRPERATVRLLDLMLEENFYSGKKLNFPLGLNKNFSPEFLDIHECPHLLIAGSTGSGKSSLLNTILCSLLIRLTPKEIKLILIDPKKVEFSPYQNIPHLWNKRILTELDEIEKAFSDLIQEMENRYKKLDFYKLKDIEGIHKKKPEIPFPYIVVLVDELADLLIENKKIEQYLLKLIQKSRACGIHFVLSTQRPSYEILKGSIKANLPTRIAFQVASPIDSSIILNERGAEKLLGKGDLLLYRPGKKLERFQGCLVEQETIEGLLLSLGFNKGE